MTAIDAFALTMLAVIFLSFGVVGLLFLSMARNASRRDPEIEKLMHQAIAGDEDAGPPAPTASPGAAWEREGDWWKKE